MNEQKFTKYETARILGARALQIAMNAPLLIKISKENLEKIKYDAIKIAEVELESGVLPISIKKPLPKIKDAELKIVKVQRISDEKKAKIEEKEEKEIIEGGEIMELANPEDEADSEAISSGNPELE